MTKISGLFSDNVSIKHLK